LRDAYREDRHTARKDDIPYLHGAAPFLEGAITMGDRYGSSCAFPTVAAGSKAWVKVKNRSHPAMKRVMEARQPYSEWMTCSGRKLDRKP
jgi:hypothetical protein